MGRHYFAHAIGHLSVKFTRSVFPAQHKALRRSLEEGRGIEEVRVWWEDMKVAMREVRPSAMKEVAIEVPKVKKGTLVFERTCTRLFPLPSSLPGTVVRHWRTGRNQTEAKGVGRMATQTPRGQRSH